MLFSFSIITNTPNETFSLPLLSGTQTFTADWGDLSSDVITIYNDPEITHTYAVAGTYIITMTGTCTGFSFNNSGDKLKLIHILGFTGDMGFTVLNFYGCSNLTSISSSMSNLLSLTTAQDMFRACTSLTTIPAGIFDGSSGITSLWGTFEGCSGISAIPTNLFKYNTSVDRIDQCFSACTSLTTIPVDLFRYNTLATNCNGIFQFCSSLTTLHSDLFKYNTNALSFYFTFANSGLAGSIPLDLFRYTVNATSFYQTFANCTWLTGTISRYLFRYNTLINTFTDVFLGCTGLDVIPTDLYKFGMTLTNFTTKIVKSKFVQTILNTVLGKSSGTFNTTLATRIGLNQSVITNLSTRLVTYTSIAPKNLNDIIVKKDGVELTDVDYSTLKIQLNLNSTPSNASFVLARRHDDLDNNLLGASSVITAQNTITIYDGTILLFTGYITKINAISGNDTVEVLAEDKRCLINNTTVSLNYGGYTALQIYNEGISTVYSTIDDALNYVLGVAGLSGSLGVTLIPEPTYFSGNCGAAIDSLIGNSINANWYLDANENFKIQKVATGPIKTLPLSGINSRRHIYDTILNDVVLNKVTNSYTPSLLVKLGKTITNRWSNWSALNRNYYLNRNTLTGELFTDIAQKEIVEDLNYIKGLMFADREPQIFVIQSGRYTGNTPSLDPNFINTGSFSGSLIASASYHAQYKYQETITDITPVTIGSGSPKKLLDMSQFGIKTTNGQLLVVNGYLGYQYEEVYNYTTYALDLAYYELSQNNKLLTEASITLILDAYEYYGLNLSDLINLSNTTLSIIYNNTNGFPLNISGVTIDCATRLVTLNASNYGKTFYQRSADYLNGYVSPMFHGVWREYVPVI